MKAVKRVIATVAVASLLGVGAATGASAASYPGFTCDGKSRTVFTSIYVYYSYTPVKVHSAAGGRVIGYFYQVVTGSTVIPVRTVLETSMYCAK